MANDMTDIKVTLARVTTTMENVGKILERHEEMHVNQEKCCNENRVGIADLNASRRTVKWVLSLFGISGIGATIKAILP